MLKIRELSTIPHFCPEKFRPLQSRFHAKMSNPRALQRHPGIKRMIRGLRNAIFPQTKVAEASARPFKGPGKVTEGPDGGLTGDDDLLHRRRAESLRRLFADGGVIDIQGLAGGVGVGDIRIGA